MLALVLLVTFTVVSGAPGDNFFGSWAADSFGNPSFAWRGGVSPDPSAIYPTTPTVLHSAGNDRISALLFSDGTVSLRQDEGGAKLLHGFTANASLYQFRGAAGFATDASGVLGATVVDGSVGVAAAPPLALALGMGYATKRAPLRGGGNVTHSIIAPFGDHSVALSIIDFEGSPPADAVWSEAWAAGARWEMGWGADINPTKDAASFQAAWAHDFVVVKDAAGAPVGLADAARIGGGRAGKRTGALPPAPSLHDPAPRPSFFVCLSCLGGTAALRSFSTRGAQVFCKDGSDCTDASAGAPLARGANALVRGLDNSTDGGAPAGRSATVLALQAAVPADGSLAFLVGYLTAADEAAAPGGTCTGDVALAACVLTKSAQWVAAAANEPAHTAAAWAAFANDVAFGLGASQSAADLARRARAAQDPAAAEPAVAYAMGPRWSSWEGREAAWHSYMLRAQLSFDDWAGVHTLNQAGNYLFISGENAAARDPLAHVMGLAWGGRSTEGFVRGVLASTLLHQKRAVEDSLGRPAGSIVWGLAAFGESAAASFNQSDTEIAAFFTLAQLVLATRTSIEENVWDAADASFHHLTDVISTGAHGLVRLLLSDHNDGLLGGLGVELTELIMSDAESVMNGGLAAYVLPLYASAVEAARVTNATSRAASARAAADAQRAAVAAQWAANGTGGEGWYRRAWLGGADAQTGWRGSPETDKTLWTETQSWALLGGVPQSTPGRADALVGLLTRVARDPSPIGAINSVPDTTVDGGVGYGGVWACGDVALISALGLRGWPDAALSEWRKSSLAAHANAYPNIWFGATAGPDVYTSVYGAAHGATPGSTRCQWNRPEPAPTCEEAAFPILNSWPHTLGTYTLPALVGAEWDVGGLSVRPPVFVSPGDNEFTVFTPLVSVTRAPGNATACTLAGHWAPNGAAGDGATIRVYLAPADAARCSRVAVNGGVWAPAVLVNGSVLINAVLAGEPPLVAWEIE